MSAPSSHKLARFHARFYPHVRDDLWLDVVRDHTSSSSICLEIGSGSGSGLQNVDRPETVKHLTGVDLDERVLSNPYLDDAHVASAYELEEVLEPRRFDVIYSHMVAEHIDDPDRFIDQQLRILANGGVMIHSTVSKYCVPSVANRLAPSWFRDAIIGRLGSGRETEDIFPAHYKLNSKRDIRRLAERHGVEFALIRQDQAPGYFRRSYVLMAMYALATKPLQAVIPALRPTLIFTVRRQ